jgi:hypothetical protein
MLLSYPLKKLLINSIVFLFCFTASAKEIDTTAYTLFNHKIVLYSDFGFRTAPFSLHYPFSSEITKIKYRNNFREIIGFGGSYKWFSLRFGIPMKGSAKSVAKYGQTKSYNIGFDFTIKKVFTDIDFRLVQGYSIKNAIQWNDTLNQGNPHSILTNATAVNLSLNSWYFNSKDFKMQAVRIRNGHYKKETYTWYIKSSVNIYGVGNGNNTLVPLSLIDTSVDKTATKTLSAFDFGIIPGYAFVKRYKNWQFSGIFGLGGVVQTKFYEVNGYTRGFLSLAPRYDVRFLGGYTDEKRFLYLETDFDNKSFRFNDFKFRQTFYSIKIVGGFRFNKKEK